MQIQICQKNPKKIATRMWQNCKARILHGKILVRNPKIHGWIFGSMFSAMQNEKSQNFTKKISAWMRSLSTERIFGTKILVRITKSMEGFCVRKTPPSRGAVALASHWTERSEGSGRG